MKVFQQRETIRGTTRLRRKPAFPAVTRTGWHEHEMRSSTLAYLGRCFPVWQEYGHAGSIRRHHVAIGSLLSETISPGKLLVAPSALIKFVH